MKWLFQATEVALKPLLISVLLIFASAAFAKAAEFEPVQLTSKQIAQIKETITYDFLDPESARFRDIRAVDVKRSNGKTIRRVCGEVNGKNQYGGYTGYSMFGGKMINGRFNRVDFFGACEKW